MPRSTDATGYIPERHASESMLARPADAPARNSERLPEVGRELEAAVARADALFACRTHDDDAGLRSLRDELAVAKDWVAAGGCGSSVSDLLLDIANEWFGLNADFRALSFHERRQRRLVLASISLARELLRER